MPFGAPGQAPRPDVAAREAVHDEVDEMPDVVEARQLLLTERGRCLLQLHPGALRRAPVQLLPHHRAAHTDVRVPRLVDVAVVAGQPLVADPVEAPFLVQLRVVDEDVAATENVVQLGHLHAVPLEVPVDDPDAVDKVLRAYGIGGVFLAGRSHASAPQLRSQIADLQSMAPPATGC